MSVPHDVLPQKISIHLPWREKLCRRAGVKKFLHSFCEEIKIVHNSTKQRNLLQPNNKNSHEASTHEKNSCSKKVARPPPLKNIMVHPLGYIAFIICLHMHSLQF